uniref:Uncharacterized protein n=1 Tax=Rhizophora mucronata TaxID=61149 RepID=A0A2P2J2N3_RHIMU
MRWRIKFYNYYTNQQRKIISNKIIKSNFTNYRPPSSLTP